MYWASWPAPDRMRRWRAPAASAARSMASTTSRSNGVCGHAPVVLQLVAHALALARLAPRRSSSARARGRAWRRSGSRMSIESVTRPGIALGMLGVTSRLPTVVTRSPPIVARDAADAGDHLGGGDERVVADAHRRGPGVVLHAVDRQPRPGDGHDALDDADREPLLLEERPLLDVQLEVGAQRAGHARLRAEVADALELVDRGAGRPCRARCRRPRARSCRP